MDLDDIFKDPDIDIVIELLGGIGTCNFIPCFQLRNGKHVVTANKAATCCKL